MLKYSKIFILLVENVERKHSKKLFKNEARIVPVISSLNINPFNVLNCIIGLKL